MRFIGKIFKFFILFNVVAVIVGLIVKMVVQPEGDETTEEFTLPTVMFGNRFVSTAESFRHGSLITFLGGVEVDLTDATVTNSASLTLLTVMGGVQVRVPPHWRVEFTNEVYAGDARLSLDDQDDLPDDAPTIHVDAKTLMGGLEVTNRPRRTTSPAP